MTNAHISYCIKKPYEPIHLDYKFIKTMEGPLIKNFISREIGEEKSHTVFIKKFEKTNTGG